MSLNEVNWRNVFGDHKSFPPDVEFFVTEGTDTEELQQKFLCHKLLLAAVSPVFQEQFFGINGSLGSFSSRLVIRIPNCNPTAFQKMLEYIYYQKPYKLNSLRSVEGGTEGIKLVMDTMDLAIRFKLKKLVSFCEETADKTVIVNNSNYLKVQQLMMNHKDLGMIHESLCEKFGSLVLTRLSRDKPNLDSQEKRQIIESEITRFRTGRPSILMCNKRTFSPDDSTMLVLPDKMSRLDDILILQEGSLSPSAMPPDEVEKTKPELKSQAGVLIKTKAFADVKVDAKYPKHNIGNGGSTINKIKSETDVTMNIPDTDSGVTVIRIEGDEDGVEKANKELVGMVGKMKNGEENDIIIDNRFHRQLIGPKGGGFKMDVDDCSKYPNKVTREMAESNYQDKVPIFKQLHKFVIGKGGANITRIRDETDTKIDQPNSGSDTDLITITGKRENVNKAVAQVQQIQSEMANITTKEIKIPSKIHNIVIGAGGKLIQSIINECDGIVIKFPEKGSGSDLVTVQGPVNDVEKAVKLLKKLSDEKQLSGISVKVKVKPQHHKFLIGRAGVHIQKIRDKTGARIIFPGADDADRGSITIVGTKEAIAATKTIVEARVKELDNIVEDSMTVDPKHHKHFVARRGEVVRRIGDEFGGVVISFPRNGVAGDRVNLKGAKGCIDAAIARINEIVKDLEDMVTIDCEIQQTYHRTVMGAKGFKVKKIITDFNVQIKFPDKAAENGEAGAITCNTDRSSDPNIIRITGNRENCEGASQALLELVPITAEVSVPHKFHRFIIGRKGVGVRDMMNKFDVNILFPAQDANSDVILISGVPTNVDAAKIGLAKKVKELEAEKEVKIQKSFKVTVEVNPKYHPKIIGRGGEVIKKLREDFNIRIKLPKRDAPNSEVITIIGFEADANAAKKAILKIVGQFESRKIMEDIKVDIRLPRKGDSDPSRVVVSGNEDAVFDCYDHLKVIEEEFIQVAAANDCMR